MDDYEIEYKVRRILEMLGKECDVKANRRTYSDSYSWLYGDMESYVTVKGSEYHFDKFYVRGYYYGGDYYFNISYGSWWDDVYGEYSKKEDGTIENKNEEIWKTYLEEVYDSRYDLEKSIDARKDFFDRIKGCDLWPELGVFYREEGTRRYFKGLGISAVVSESTPVEEFDLPTRIYKIYDGQDCVYDSVENVFIDGPWKEKLISYLLDEKSRKEARQSSARQKTFNDSLRRLRSIREDDKDY